MASTQLARSSNAPTSAPRRGPVGISKAKAESLARSAGARSSRAAKEALKQKALIVAPVSAVGFGAIEKHLPDLPMGIPKPLGYGLALAVGGAFMGGKMGELGMIAGLGPLCAGAYAVGKAGGLSTTVGGEFDDVGGEFDDIG
jgi:hypothetical protein